MIEGIKPPMKGNDLLYRLPFDDAAQSMHRGGSSRSGRRGAKQVARAIAIAVVSGLLLTGCFFDRSAAVVGNWQATTTGGGSIEFFRDGTLNGSGSAFGIPISQVGKYKFLDDDRVSFEFGGLLGLAGPTIFRLSLTGNELTLTDSMGNTTKYRKV